MDRTDDAKRPKEPVALTYATVKKEMIMAVRDVMRRHPLPLYMIHSILESITGELQNESYLELADEAQGYESALQMYYEECKEQLIKDFEGEKEG